ncbi:hypothetical protein KC678_00165 [Candidatus Dojkabacteria bacterium]|uniref:Cohesin domain-containing protein n=1 Tax=Candidatus Dojkabacteria bacterium TaxID=2099670 RepID=A0A955IC33_9BACT|nr:hypothetical protein [Candidatus Dojkabacteria bacterium]
MRKIAKSTVIMLFVFAITSVFVSPVKAIQLDGETQLDLGDTTAVEILANPTMTDATTAQISLGLEDKLKVVEYVPPLNPTWSPEIGTCENGALFESNTVCVDLIKLDGTIEIGESLGIFVVQGAMPGEGNIFGFSDNGYKNANGDFEAQSGLLYKIVVSGDETLPTTSGQPPATDNPYIPTTTSIPETALFIKDNTMFKAFISFMMAATLALFAILMQYVDRKNIMLAFNGYKENIQDFFAALKEEEQEYKKEQYASKVLKSKQYKNE